MKAVILCGGLATRLGGDKRSRPKALMEVGQKPILWHIMKHYAVYGIKDFIHCLGYKGHVIREYFENYHSRNCDLKINIGTGDVSVLQPAGELEDWTIIVADTGQLTGTGGRIKRIEKYIEGDTFLATYGDSLVDVSISKLIEFHHSKRRIATVTGVRPHSRFGLFSSDRGIADDFEEKPKIKQGWVNGGFFVFDKKIFNYLDDDCFLENHPIDKLVADRQLAVFEHSGTHRCLDTFKDWRRLNDEWETGQAPWRTW